MPEFTQLESGKSIIRYLPANGTAASERSAVSALSTLLSPPARMSASVRSILLPLIYRRHRRCTASRGIIEREEAAMIAHPAQPATIFYPESDGEPVGETDDHRELMFALIFAL